MREAAIAAGLATSFGAGLALFFISVFTLGPIWHTVTGIAAVISSLLIFLARILSPIAD